MKKNKVLNIISTVGILAIGASITTSASKKYYTNFGSSELTKFMNGYSATQAKSNFNKRVVQENKNIITIVNELDPGPASTLEGRLMYHPNDLTTGLLVRKGQKIKINVIEQNKNTKPSIWIAAPGTWTGLKHTGRQYRSLKPGKNEFIAEKDGILYMAIIGSNSIATFEIDNTGLQQVPVFYKGDNMLKFFEEVKTSKSPVVNIVSDWMTTMLGTNQLKSTFLNNEGKLKHSVTLEKTLNKWDELSNYYKEEAGLLLNGTGVSKKYKHKLNLFVSKGSFGWANSGGMVSIGDNWFHGTLKGRAEWIIGHEVGHTWQNPNMSWASVSETIPNIFAALWQEKYHALSNKEHAWNTVVGEKMRVMNNIKNAMANNGFSNFDSLGWSEQLMMFLQLQKGFGKNFMPILSQYYRIHYNKNIHGRTGLTEEEKLMKDTGQDVEGKFKDIINNTDEEKRQSFMRAVIDITDYNLIPFFNMWGMKPNKETIALAKDKKIVTKPIQTNYLQGTSVKKMVIQESLPKYNPIQIQQKDLVKEISVYRQEPKYITEQHLLDKLKNKIPSNYKLEIIGEKNIERRTNKVMINIYDPKNKYATENAFWINVKRNNGFPKDTQIIPNYIFQDLIEIDVDKKMGDTDFIKGLLIPTETKFDDLWIFDDHKNVYKYYRYNSKTTKLKDGMMIRLILDPAYQYKFANNASYPRAFDENNERIYVKANGMLVYEKLIKKSI